MHRSQVFYVPSRQIGIDTSAKLQIPMLFKAVINAAHSRYQAWSVFISLLRTEYRARWMQFLWVWSVSQVMCTPLNLLLITSHDDLSKSFSSPRPWMYVAKSEIVAENNDGSCTILWLASLARIPSRWLAVNISSSARDSSVYGLSSSKMMALNNLQMHPTYSI